MTVETSPLQTLDDAIHTFFKDTGVLEDGAWITGWVIGASTARVDAEPGENLPLVTGAQYALGPQTSTTNAADIIRFLDVVLERATWDMLNGDDDE